MGVLYGFEIVVQKPGYVVLAIEKNCNCNIHFRKVKATDSVHVLINLFVALFLLNVAFLSNEYVARAKDITACKVMAGFMHYCLLSSFTWFALEAFHLCMQMVKHSVTIKHYIIKISLVGWGEFTILNMHSEVHY